ncbi:hypothetical protein OESDEN_07077 [Oesophagostomum dentatum]|uniref:Uncharacterized protein n=1 Tax=Oesophagostomum dentatum TaxID=61180 RepID=A0A0B1T700_OESDE|nr:hypothetical protein OESDEN_07077 [Oesophagostomum dentatum]
MSVKYSSHLEPLIKMVPFLNKSVDEEITLKFILKKYEEVQLGVTTPEPYLSNALWLWTQNPNQVEDKNEYSCSIDVKPHETNKYNIRTLVCLFLQ